MIRSHDSGVPFGDKSTETMSAADQMKEFSRSSSSGVTSPAAKRRKSSARWRPSIARMSTGSVEARQDAGKARIGADTVEVRPIET